MKLRASYGVLTVFFVLYFAARLFFSLQSDYFNSDTSYFALREIEHIKATGKPLIHDTLSYSGRDFVFMPFYYYFLAFFAKFFPEVIAIKVINSLLASAIIPAMFLCINKLIKNTKIAVISSIIGSLSPFYITMTLNDITPYSVVIPGMILIFFFFMRLDEDIEILNYLIPVTLAIVISSPVVFIVILALLMFFVICYVEKIAIKKVLFEYSSFFILFFFWTNFILYKTAFQKHGISIISGNIPEEAIRQYFNIDIGQTFLSIGIITSILGIYSVYKYTAGKKRKDIMVFISLFFSVMVLFLARLIEAQLALALLSLSLIILSSQAINDIFETLEKTKAAKYSKTIFFALMALLIVAQGLPGIFAFPQTIKGGLNEKYVSDLIWIKENTPVGSVITATVQEGNLITYFSNRKNIADTNYLLADDPKERLSDIDNIFRTSLRVEAVMTLDKYGSEYILLSEKSKNEYNIEELKYSGDNCFNIVLESYVKLYKKDESCKVKSYEN